MPERRRSGVARDLAGMAAVAATYVYFLLWAQFGLVALVRERLADPGAVRGAMAAMGVAGLAASLVTGALLARRRGPAPTHRLVALGLAASGGSALAALACRSAPSFAAVAALTGAATAWTTVSLAAGLRRLIRGPRLGLAVGASTGAAYLVCNVPAVFEAAPRLQALGAALACGAGAAALLLGSREADREEAAPRPLLPRRLYRRAALAGVVAAFLALVWLDSAAFAVIQEAPELSALTWGTADGKVLLGGVHLAAAVAAGALLDAGFLLAPLLGTAGLFALALPLLGTGGGLLSGPLAGALYAVGISAYSTALVVYPAGTPAGGGSVHPAWRAALLYGVAGWLGSALGVGMAQDLHRIPGAAVAAAMALAIGGVLAARLAGRPAAGAALAGLYGPALLLGSLLAAATLALGPAGQAGAPSASAVERGRAVYRAEGCIHCHSQYARPGSLDEVPWGPHRPLDRRQTPPLLGVRRQGPDLGNVGNRRGAAWQRLHLLDPRTLSPASRMPSYARLFEEPGAAGASRGEDLVAYLQSLGEGTGAARRELVERAPVPAAAEIARASAERGRGLFGRHCAACHGAGGRGDGPLAGDLRRPGLDLRKGTLWSVSWGVGVDAEPEGEAVARLIRFGIPGSSMPGHETLALEQVAELAAFVETLVHGDSPERGDRVAAAGGGDRP